mmetsp:Transcript_44774/g.110958  ORF Transcript_44774/g.110958 Transcript_44774/m.110958 type:complete len:230 (-) Transcript_44774:127-816(-)
MSAAESFAQLDSFADPRLAWMNRPGAGGEASTHLPTDGSSLTITPALGCDFWARTFYSPLMLKSDGCALVAPVLAAAEVTLSVGFTLDVKAQFDQAGAFVHVDDGTWVKCGIEMCDKVPRLSVVVTNEGFSDWSTQLLPFLALRLRVSKLAPGDMQGPAILVEASPYQEGAGVDSPGDWQFVRIASLRSADKPWRMGVFAAAPVKAGCSGEFHYLRIGPKLEASHSQQL